MIDLQGCRQRGIKQVSIAVMKLQVFAWWVQCLIMQDWKLAHTHYDAHERRCFFSFVLTCRMCSRWSPSTGQEAYIGIM